MDNTACTCAWKPCIVGVRACIVHADSIGRQFTSLKAFSRRTRESGAHASTLIKAHAAATKLGDDDESALCRLTSTWGLADRMVSRSASEASPRSARRPAAGVAQWASVRAKSLTETSRTSALMASSRLACVFLSEGQRSCQSSSPAWECGHVDEMHSVSLFLKWAELRYTQVPPVLDLKLVCTGMLLSSWQLRCNISSSNSVPGLWELCSHWYSCRLRL